MLQTFSKFSYFLYGMFLYLVTEDTNRTTYVYISALVKDRCPCPIVLELFFSALACSEKLTVVFGEGAQYGSCENTFAVLPVLQGVSQSMACSVYMQGVHLTNAGMSDCPACNHSGAGKNTMLMPEPVRYRVKKTQSGTGLRYRNLVM
jgi:hypothetical protein